MSKEDLATLKANGSEARLQMADGRLVAEIHGPLCSAVIAAVRDWRDTNLPSSPLWICQAPTLH